MMIVVMTVGILISRTTAPADPRAFDTLGTLEERLA
jgi:hypothetical protein